MALVSPDLERLRVLLVHDPDALEDTLLNLQRSEACFERLEEDLAILLLASSLQVIDMSRYDEHEPAGTGWR